MTGRLGRSTARYYMIFLGFLRQKSFHGITFLLKGLEKYLRYPTIRVGALSTVRIRVGMLTISEILLSGFMSGL